MSLTCCRGAAAFSAIRASIIPRVTHRPAFLRTLLLHAVLIEKKGGGTRPVIGRRTWKQRMIKVMAAEGSPPSLAWWASVEDHHCGAPPLKPPLDLTGATAQVLQPSMLEGSGRRVYPIDVSLVGQRRFALRLRTGAFSTSSCHSSNSLAALAHCGRGPSTSRQLFHRAC